MSDYDGTILFKDWLPDQPDLNNPGLIEATNVVPIDGTYRSYAPLSGSGTANALSGTIVGAFMVRYGSATEIYAAALFTSNSRIYRNSGSGWVESSATLGVTNSDGASFTQFDDLLFAAASGAGLLAHSLNGVTTFNAVSVEGVTQSPTIVGRIGQFLVVGGFPNTATENTASIRWSSIANPLAFPVPNSSTAIASQSGEQFFGLEGGPVTAICGGDQFGLVFQSGAISRLSYVGGDAVFQIEKISDRYGAFFRNAVIYGVSGLTYFISRSGFFVTDGVSVKPIAENKVSRSFIDAVLTDNSGRVYGAYDGKRSLIYWCYAVTGASGAMQNRVLIYNILDGRFALAQDQVSSIFTSHEGNMGGLVPTFDGPPMGFMSGGTLGSFSGTPGSAVLTTGETEPNPGGFSRMQGVKPLVDATLNAVTISLGTRNDRSSSVSYTSETTANSRSGFANFRSEARYHRARLTITGTFNAAQGLEYEAVPSGYT